MRVETKQCYEIYRPHSNINSGPNLAFTTLMDQSTINTPDCVIEKAANAKVESQPATAWRCLVFFWIHAGTFGVVTWRGDVPCRHVRSQNMTIHKIKNLLKETWNLFENTKEDRHLRPNHSGPPWLGGPTSCTDSHQLALMNARLKAKLSLSTLIASDITKAITRSIWKDLHSHSMDENEW